MTIQERAGMAYMSKAFRLVSAAVCAAFLAAPLTARAKSVEPERAQELARRVAESARGKTDVSDVRLKHVAKESRGAQTVGGLGRVAADADDTLFYVFELGGEGGFVIVSADDAVKPVLGYSDGGSYDPQSLPPNTAAWMERLRRQIVWAKERGVRSESAAAVTPLNAGVSALLRTQWDQYEPYNLLCPKVDSARAAAGCAITAWAQIMKYHNHPARGVGRSEAYATNTYKINIPSVNFEIGYNWADMRNTYPENEENTPQNIAVATLMYHLGVSVKTDYLPEGSIADGLSDALTAHFGYDLGMRRVDRERFQRVYGKAKWEELLKGQIDAGLPVLYGGSDPRAGHEFIVDGYDNSGKFHINWGWGGRYNGYYEIDAFVDISADMYDFSNIRYQYAYVDIKPNAGGVRASYNPNFTLAEIAAAKTDVAPVERFTVNAKITCDTAAYVAAAQLMLVGAALVDGRDSIAAILGKVRAGIYPWKPDTATAISCVVPAAVSAGAYSLKIAVSEYDYDSAAKEYVPRGWKIVTRSASGVQNNVAVNVTQVPIITVQPSDQRVSAGAAATFTVEAKSNGAAAISGYKWQIETADTILAENFEGAANVFTIVNGTQTNKWSVGSAVAKGSGKSVYVSNNGGASNAYSAASESVAHLYVDVAFPANPDAQPYTLGFDWKGMGKDKPLDCYSTDDGLVCTGFGGGVDYLQVSLTDTSVSPQAGNSVAGADLGIYYGSDVWKRAVCSVPALNAGKKKRVVFTWYNAATDSVVNPPVALDNITITGNRRFVDVKDGTGATTAAYAAPAATPSMNGSRYRCVVTNALGNSTVSDYATLSVADSSGVAVLVSERNVPAPFAKTEAASIAPLTASSAGLTAGPNIVDRRSGGVTFFRGGSAVADADLRIYDALGNLVRAVNVRAKTDSCPGVGKRVAASWDLRDYGGRAVPPGSYAVVGTVAARNGKRERVSAVVTVR